MTHLFSAIRLYIKKLIYETTVSKWFNNKALDIYGEIQSSDS